MFKGLLSKFSTLFTTVMIYFTIVKPSLTYKRNIGVIYQGNSAYSYSNVRLNGSTVSMDVNSCKGKVTLFNMASCVCIATPESIDMRIITYLPETKSHWMTKLLHGFRQGSTAAMTKLSKQSTAYKQKAGHLLGVLATQFGVRGTTVIKCNGYDQELKALVESYIKTESKGDFHTPTIIYFHGKGDDLVSMTAQLYLVKSTDSSSIVILCPPTYSSLILQMSKRLGMENTRYAWLLLELVHVISLETPTNVLAIVPIIANNTMASPEELQLLTNSEPEVNSAKVFSTNITFCNNVRQHLKPQNTTDRSFFTSSIKRTYNFNILTLTSKKQWLSIGKFTDQSILLFQDLSNVMTTFPRHLILRKVRVVTIVDPPFVLVRTKAYWESAQKNCQLGIICWRAISNGTGTRMVPECCIGYIIDFLLKLQVDIGLQVYLYIVKDSTYGSYDFERKRWTGLVGDIAEGKADIACAALTISSGRAQVVDFSDPFMTGGIGLLTLSMKEELKFFNFEFLKPLSTVLWMVVLAIVLVFSFFMILTERIVSLYRPTYVWREAILYLIGLAFQRDLGGKNPAGLGTRTATITIAVATMIIMSTYTAVLTANKVSTKAQLPISGFRDNKIINPTTAFVYASPKNSIYTSFFKESKDPGFNRMYHFMKPYNFIDTEKAIEHLKGGTLHAIIHDYPVLYYFASKDPSCQLQFAGEPLPDPGYGLAVARNSQLKVPLSDAIRRYKEDGYLQRWKKKWLDTKCVSSSDATNNVNPRELTISHFGGLIISVIISIGVSTLVYLVEILVWRVKSRYVASVQVT